MVDVNALQIPAKFLKSELSQLKDIDKQILELMNLEDKPEPTLSRQQLDSLLQGCV
jgi:hypothetical protein